MKNAVFSLSLLYGLFFVLPVFAQTPPQATSQAASPLALPDMEVHATTPLMGLGVPHEQVPANVQVVTGERIANRGGISLTDTLARELAGINLTHVQNNPFQPDFSYRGFTSSFLLGTPPGLSVFVDGVRVNEPLADQVNWDLIPTDAIDRVELLPGSNPVYGRNTLGGAIIMRTKRGFSHPGTTAEIWGGSFGRFRSLLQTGGSTGNFDYFASGNFFLEDGFRDFSDSHASNLFGKFGYMDDKQDGSLSLTYVNNRLTGNGPLPESRLRRDRSAVFTHSDRFKPILWFLNGAYRRDLTAGLSLSSNVYARLLDIDQFNPGVDEEVDARTNQKGWGGTTQLAYQGGLFGLLLTATAGADYSGAQLDHLIGERQKGRNLAGRGEEEKFAVATDVKTETHAGGPFVTVTVTPIERLAVTVSGRFDVTHLKIKDRLAGRDTTASDGTDASGSHTFKRFNPAVGATYQLVTGLSLYANYSESYRAPTAIELTCANPEAPCPIPTAIVDDPPLDPVKGKTWETGIRWSPFPTLQATLAFFRTDLKDDILFRNDPESQLLGFFQNVDATRRQGIEFLLRGQWAWGRWFANYTLTDATFEDAIELFTFANEERLARVKAGDRLPLVPAHRVNGGVEVSLFSNWWLSMDAAYVDGQYLRGDETNERQPLDPYFVTTAQLAYKTEHFDIFVRFENLFDTKYESYGALFENTLGETGVERFLGPGAPFGVGGGVRVKF